MKIIVQKCVGNQFLLAMYPDGGNLLQYISDRANTVMKHASSIAEFNEIMDSLLSNAGAFHYEFLNYDYTVIDDIENYSGAAILALHPAPTDVLQ